MYVAMGVKELHLFIGSGVVARLLKVVTGGHPALKRRSAEAEESV